MSDQMTKAEARELKSLVRSEFNVLSDEVERRAKELKKEADQAYRAKQVDVKEAVKPYERKFATLVTRFNRAVGELVDDVTANEGLELSRSRSSLMVQGDGEFFRAFVAKTVGDKEYHAAIDEIQKTVWQVEAELDRREQDLVRQLTLNTLSSQAALAFFEAIPTAEGLLPRPKALDRLTA